MPKLGGSTIERVILPSTANEKKVEDKAWVDVETSFSVEDFLRGVDEKERSGQLLAVLSSVIKDWNYNDDKGEKVGINAESVKKLKLVDMLAILKPLNLESLDQFGVSLEKKES